IGLLYIETFKELKLLYGDNTYTSEYKSAPDTNEFDFVNIDTSNMRIRIGADNEKYLAPLVKYLRMHGVKNYSDAISDIINIDRDALFKISGFGNVAVTKIMDFREILIKEI